MIGALATQSRFGVATRRVTVAKARSTADDFTSGNDSFLVEVSLDAFVAAIAPAVIATAKANDVVRLVRTSC